ncbi:hypothetical protein [Glutamicibacter mysorens]|uniref:hypothetical protein n=1 Tax=Glutamicibacter mysorens TaxID=257984 RepID=UPI0020C5D4E6|nr:hypothetical protein [Glutamicibacter mysorens]UTM48661.1 hypothetical protein XH9_07725 [Glutamicibacter mysorens]
MYSPNKNIRYQQTWHTIEFSNNKHLPVLYPPFQAVISSSVIFIFYNFEFLKVKSIVCDLNQYSQFPFFSIPYPQDCGKTLIFWGSAAVELRVFCSVLFSATRKNYTRVLGVLQIGGVVLAGDRAHLISQRRLKREF